MATGILEKAKEIINPDLLVKQAAKAYVYFYPLVVFGVSMEVLTNVEQPTWERLSAPLNQFMSVRHNRPDNHGVILPSTDTLYTLAWVDVTKEPVVFKTSAIPDGPTHHLSPLLSFVLIFPIGTIGAYGGCRLSASRYAAWESSEGDLFEDGDQEVYRDLLADQTRKAAVEVWAYCLMPNHVHLILTPTRADGLGLAVGEAHRRYTNFINARGRWTGHLFQSRPLLPILPLCSRR
jgi:hypothetical protein